MNRIRTILAGTILATVVGSSALVATAFAQDGSDDTTAAASAHRGRHHEVGDDHGRHHAGRHHGGRHHEAGDDHGHHGRHHGGRHHEAGDDHGRHGRR